ncbi:post-COAP-1 domain-containing protein [Gemmatimonadota bacterium]
MRTLPLVLIAVFAFAFSACDEQGQVPTEPMEIAQPSAPSFSVVTTPPLTFDYGNFPSLDKAGISFPQRWAVTACDLTLSYGVAMTGSSGWQPVSVGLREPTSANPFPNVYPHGEAGWMEAIPSEAGPTNPVLADLDDHFLLVGHGWNDDELIYNSLTPGTTEAAFGSYVSHAFWFDRDGVDATQATFWNYKDGITYNTSGNYAVSVLFTQVGSSAIEATMFATINGEAQGFYSPSYQSTGPPEVQPVGRSFTVADLSDLRVFAGSDGGSQSVTDLSVTGCLVLESGMATGGGWFIPEPSNAEGLTLDGSKATFGFNAKQAKGQSTGHLEFQYHGDGLTLNSTSYDWVTLATTQVMFEGIGTLNGEPGIKFRVRAVDGDKIGTGIDRFEIRIWTGGDNFDAPTYRAEGDLGGGQIVVRKK